MTVEDQVRAGLARIKKEVIDPLKAENTRLKARVVELEGVHALARVSHDALLALVSNYAGKLFKVGFPDPTGDELKTFDAVMALTDEFSTKSNAALAKGGNDATDR